MGKSSSQVVGYRYSAKFAMFIGNRIEKLLAINFDNRKWVVHDPLKHPPNLLPVLEGNLFGENEGGVSGNVDIHFGYPDPEPNLEYQKYFPLVSGYPYQSYLIFRGYPEAAAFTAESLAKNGFYLGNSGYMKEMLLWVKRIHVKNDGDVQWHDAKSEVVNPNKIISPGSSTTLDQTILTSTLSVGANSYFKPGGLPSKEEWRSSNSDFTFRDPSEIKTIPVYISNSLAGGIPEGLEIDKLKSWGEFNVVLSSPATLVIELTVSWIGLNISFTFTGSIFDVISIETVSLPEDSDGAVLKETTCILRGANFTEFNCSYVVTGAQDLPNTVSGHIYSISQSIDFLKIKTTDIPAVYAESGDINPIHKIREILTDDTAMGKPESDVNDVNFVKAADRIYDEGLGISWAIDEKSCSEAIEELCYHIEAGIRVNRQTGLYEMVLFRDDWFTEDEIHDISENKIKGLSLEIMNSDDMVNQLNVTYYDRERIKNSTFSVYENGSILTMGHTNAESVEFPYFMNMRNAEIVANWKLKQFSTPAWSGSFTTGWREARKWNRYDLIRLPWSSKWNGTILARIMKINLGNGTDNTVTIDFEEVIPYSSEMNTSIVVDTPVDTAPQPPQPSINAVFEVPYYLTVLRAGQTNADLELSNNPDIGYIAAIAAKPQNNSLNALLYTDGGAGEFEQVSRLDYCDILQLDQPITEASSSFTVTGSLTQTANSSSLILLNDELVGFVSFDDATKVLTVKRGVLDTVPQKHSNGSLFVFDLPDVAFDSTQYAQSEVVEAQVLTTTPSGVQELSATGVPVEIQARAIRPYPPANVKINGIYYPESHVITNDIILTWADRNRLQQTGGGVLGFFDTGVTVESGVTYSYELTSENVILDSASGINANTVTIPVSTLIPNKVHTLKLWSVRDGYESYQVFEHSFFVEAVSLILTATTDGSGVVGNTIPTANISVNVDESLSANMRFDGSSISGKAEAGATITIEIQE